MHQNGLELLEKYFSFSNDEREKMRLFVDVLLEMNKKVNLISRKDEAHIYERHVLHSLAPGLFVDPAEYGKIMDGGTGGGFPGIPLAICYPYSEFVLVDSRRKKVEALSEIIKEMNLQNVRTLHSRIEDCKEKFDAAIFRAVAPLPKLVAWSRGRVHKRIWCLKGGDLREETEGINYKVRQMALSKYIEEAFFEEKYLLDVDLTT